MPEGGGRSFRKGRRGRKKRSGREGENQKWASMDAEEAPGTKRRLESRRRDRDQGGCARARVEEGKSQGQDSGGGW